MMEIGITGACVIKQNYDNDYPSYYWAIIASTEPGEVYILCHSFKTESKAKKRLIKIVEKKIINLEQWRFYRTIYGSEAYQQQT